METQRQLDEDSGSSAIKAERMMSNILQSLQEAFQSQTEVLSALNESQRAFVVYQEQHLKLVSAVNDGTTAPLIRNAAMDSLFKQRSRTLREFLEQSKPDFEEV